MRLPTYKSNLGKFYSHANKKFTAKSGVGVLKSDNDAYVVDASEQAELMNKYFTTTFTVDDNVLPHFPSRVTTGEGLANILFDCNLVYKKLRNLKSNSSPGPDGLRPLMLSKLAPSIAHPLR